MALARIGSFMMGPMTRHSMNSVRTVSTVPVSGQIRSPSLPYFMAGPQQPWHMNSESGFGVRTEIRPSIIPEAGTGRFTLVPVKSGAVVRCDPLVSVHEYVGASRFLQNTVAIEMKNTDDIDQLAEHWRAGEADQFKIRQMMSWFMAGVPASRTDRREALVYILGHSFHTNHGESPNIQTVVENGHLYHKATCDIAPQEELFLDYLIMDIEPFCKEWCDKHRLTDVQTLAFNIVKQASK